MPSAGSEAQRTVLLVDEDPTTGRLVRLSLHGPRCQVVVAQSYDEGISLAAVVWLMAAVLEHLRFGWRTIAVRVVGSWIAAAGLLMLGWQLRSGQGAG